MNITLVKVDGRSLIPQDMVVGNQGDFLVEALQFEVPQMFEGQSAWAVYKRSDAVTDTALLGADGVWQIDRTITRTPGTLDVFLRIISSDQAQVWDSNVVRFLVRPLFPITENTISDDPDQLERAQAVIGAYAAEAGQEAENAARSASDAEGSAQEAEDQAQNAAGSASAAASSANAAAGSASEAAQSVRDAADMAEAAEGSAGAAAQSARDAAGSAGDAAESARDAEESAQDAADSAQEANEAVESLDFPRVEVTTLRAEQQATAQWDTQGENPVLVLGLPRGRDGKGVGDMVKADYDSNNDGIVNKADTIAGTIRMDQVNGLVGHVTNYMNPHNVTARQTGAATAMAFEAVLPASGWVGESAPYSQVVAVEGILETDAPVVDMALTGNETVDGPTREAWACVSRIVTGNGTITAYAWGIPAANIPIIMQVTRGNGRGFGGEDFAPTIQQSASGDIATIEDAAALPALSAVAMIEPVQSGEGDPSPQNIRPITGHDGCTLTVSPLEGEGTTYEATFPQTVYGGSYDFVTGRLVVDRGFIESYAGETLPGKWISSMDVYQEGAVPTTGAQVCYELASPLTYDLTPQQVDMLFGYNQVFSSTGESRVVYIADTKTYVDDTVSGLGLIVAGGKLCMEVDE